MRDLPDFYSHVSPSFSSIRPDQTLQMISWNVDVDADSSSTKHTDIDLPGKLLLSILFISFPTPCHLLSGLNLRSMMFLMSPRMSRDLTQSTC